MKKRELILLLLFCAISVYASAKDNNNNTLLKKFLVLKFNSMEMDTTTYAINLDSAKMLYFNQFLTDSVPYDKRYSTLQSEIDSLRNETIGLQENVVQGTYNSTKLWVKILLFSVSFLLLLTILYVTLRLRGLRDEIVDVVKDSGRIKEWLSKSFEKPSQPTMAKSYDHEIRNLQSENRDLKDRVAALEDALRNHNTSAATEFNTFDNQFSSSKPVETQKMLYADSIIDGVFSHVREYENDDTVFVLKLKNDTNASIMLYKGAYNKVLANASYLEGCEKQILGSNSVEIAREGEAELESNGKWKVVTPLKVEIR